MKKIFLRVVVFISILSMLIQVLSPFAASLPQIAYAEETTTADSPTDTITPTPANTIENSPTPTPEEIQPTETPTPTPEEAPTSTVTPSLQDSPTPTDTPTVDNLSPPSNTDSNTSTNNQGSDNSSGILGTNTSITPGSSPSVTIDPNQDGLTSSSNTQDSTQNEQISAIILKNVSAPSLNLENQVSEGSATLTTDKADYAPTDTALITGSNLLPNTTYSLTISSNDEPPTSTTVDVTSNDEGVFVYAYQLDGTYRPNYKVELKDFEGNVVATTTFTDSVRNFSASISPTSVNTTTGQAYTLTVTNSSSSDKDIKSFTVLIPTGFSTPPSFVSPVNDNDDDAWNITYDSTNRLLKAKGVGGAKLNKNHNPSDYLTFTVTTTSPGIPNAYEWTARAWETDDWTDNAKEFTIVSSQPSVEVTVPPDTTAPTDPLDVNSTSHEVDTASSDNAIDMTWTVAGSAPGATDAGSGVDGYSYEFSNSSSTVPDTTKDAEEGATGTTSSALADGSWYFHLRTRDNAGNWTSTVHVGPFIIDTTAPRSYLK